MGTSRRRSGKAPRPAHHIARWTPESTVCVPKAVRTCPHWDVTVIAEGDGVTWVGFAQAARTVSVTASAPANTSPAGFPEYSTTGIAPRRRCRVHLRGGVSKIHYGATWRRNWPVFVKRADGHLRWGLTADSQLDAPFVDHLYAIHGQRRPLDRHVCRRGSVPVQGDRRRRANAPAACRRFQCASKRLPASRAFPRVRSSRARCRRQPADGEWHDTPTSSGAGKVIPARTRLSATTSVYPIYYDLVATDGEKPAPRGVVHRITNHILDATATSWPTLTASEPAGAGGRRT